MPEKTKLVNQTKIIRNMMQCLVCGDTIASKSRTDFKTCLCGNIGIEGGTDFLRYLHTGKGQFRNLSVVRQVG